MVGGAFGQLLGRLDLASHVWLRDKCRERQLCLTLWLKVQHWVEVAVPDTDKKSVKRGCWCYWCC